MYPEAQRAYSDYLAFAMKPPLNLVPSITIHQFLYTISLMGVEIRGHRGQGPLVIPALIDIASYV